MMYDYIIVGAGLFGAVFAHEALKTGKKILVIERRPHVGGNCYTEEVNGIQVHKYGAHIFHTSDPAIWDYVNQFAAFNHFINSPIALYHKEAYSLPFNMHTFYEMWGVTSPAQAKRMIDKQRKEAGIENPKNLEEQAISLVGIDIYNKMIKGYTEKQWGRPCAELPVEIIKRLPVRFTFDNNYFNDVYQGVPIDGYTEMVENMLDGIEVVTQCDYLKNRGLINAMADKVIYTGPIDAYFNFCFGPLEYRGLKFLSESLNLANYQGNAVINFTDKEVAYTRVIEHKWFNFGKDRNWHKIPWTVFTKEYPMEWVPGMEPYYPINNSGNDILYERYRRLADTEEKTIFGGRLGTYRYLNMDEVVKEALQLAYKELGGVE